MPQYIVVTPLRCGDGAEPIAPGEPVPAGLLDDTDAGVLIRLGALSVAEVGAEPIALPPPPPLDAPGKPLSAMKRAELAVAAEAAGVVIAVGMTNKQIVAAIEATRAGAGA